MALWIQYLIAFAALLVLVLVPLIAWAGRRFGSKAWINPHLDPAGVGAVLDQPAKHAIEATEPVKGSPENGEPPVY